MKLKALKSFRLENTTRGCMEDRWKDAIFEMSEEEEAEAIYGFLLDGLVVVQDEKFIPSDQRYFVNHGITIQTPDGLTKTHLPGKEISLLPEIACGFLVSGHIKPVDEKAWIPKRLVKPGVSSTAEPKRMFDEPEPKKETWVNRYKGGGK